MYKIQPKKRYEKTFEILKKFASENCTILDLGIKNPFSEKMQKAGYKVINTQGEDLDFHQNFPKADFVTALEILEHLVNPFGVLLKIPSDKILISVPLKLWFSKAYRSKTDPRDCHYHEFEAWQLDFLLEKTGWEIKYREKWTNPIKKIGIRSFFRLFTPRYYAVYAERIKK